MNPVIRLWKWALFSAPMLWVLGLNVLIYHAVAFILILIVFEQAYRNEKGIIIPFSLYFLGWIFFVYAVSLLIHASENDSSRVIASIYNLSFWAMGFLLVLVMTNAFTLSKIKEILKIFPFLALLSTISACIVFIAIVSGKDSLTFSTPLYFFSKYANHTPLIENSLLIQPIYKDWVESKMQSRFNFLSPYPTATGGVLLMIALCLPAWQAVRDKKNFWIFAILLSGTLFGLFLTLSRMALMAYVFAVIFVLLVQKKRLFLWIFFALMILLLALPWIIQGADWVLKWREESTLGRLALYRYSLEQLRGMDWLIGMGLKPRVESAFAMPLGSHSTYISLMLKSGLAGTLVFFIFQVYLILRWYSLKAKAAVFPEVYAFWKALGRVFFGMGLWVVTQDLDAPQLVCFLYFSMVGFFEAFRRGLNHELS